jgi:glycosyltransferase involved in cell wall biosynthesis
LRILQVTPHYYPEFHFGGPPRKIHSLNKRLVQSGFEVQVLTFDSKSPRACEQREVEGVNVQYLPWIGCGLRQCPLAWNILRTAVRNSDVVHLYSLYNLLCPSAAYYARKYTRPFVLEPLGMHPPRARNRNAKRLYNAFFTSWMVRRAKAVVATSSREFEELRAIVSNGDLVLRQNGIEVEAFAKLPDRGDFQERHDLLPANKHILFLGRISPIKNLEALLLAFEQAGLANTVLLLAGPLEETEYVERLRTVIRARSLSGRVRLLGPLYDEEMRAALAAADLFVLPSLNESFGNAAAEAVAAGIPVLLTDTCGIAPMIHGRAGLSVSLGVQSLAAGLRVMMDDDHRQMFTSKRAEVLRELSWEEPIRQTAELYQQVLACRPQ